MAVRPPATFRDVPDGPMLIVLGYLPFRDRVSLSQTCTRLRHLAINEGMLSQEEHVLSSPASAWLVLAHRAQNLKATTTEALRTFLWGYSWPSQPKWSISRLELCTCSNDNTILGERVGALVPSIATLAIRGPDQTLLRIESPALVVGLTRCTELQLSTSYFQDGVHVAPEVFAALPNLRTLSWEMPSLTSAPPGPDASPFGPILGSLETLNLRFNSGGSGEELLAQLQPHVPNLKHLTLERMGGQVMPSAVLGLTTLESLSLHLPHWATHVPDDISRLTKLTRLRCKGRSLASVPAAIGSLALLQSLVLLSGSGFTTVPPVVRDLTRLTELRFFNDSGVGITSYPDLSRLHNLKVLGLEDTHMGFADFASSEHSLPMLECLTIGVHHGPANLVPTVAFRPQLRFLSMWNIRGPLPDNMSRMSNLTKLAVTFGDLQALPDSLGELRALEVLEVNHCGLTALPATLAGLSRLRALRVMGNHLQSCPSFRGLRRLSHLALSDNDLLSLPEGIANLRLLTFVSIHTNRMYNLEWAVLRRLPLDGHRMPDTFDPSNEHLRKVLRMRPANMTVTNAPVAHPRVVV